MYAKVSIYHGDRGGYSDPLHEWRDVQDLATSAGGRKVTLSLMAGGTVVVLLGGRDRLVTTPWVETPGAWG